MRFLYEPHIIRRFADGRIFHVNPGMPFEFFMNCFQNEQPFFMVSMLNDGRVAITPNTSFVSWDVLKGGNDTFDLLPADYEYVTIKDATHPLIVTAHPVKDFDKWMRDFSRWVIPFGRQTLEDFLLTSHEYQPLSVFKDKIQKREAVEV